MNVLVIQEKDHDDNEESVIGVASTILKAEELIVEYYGKENFKEISFTDIRDSGLEYSKVLEVNHNKKTYKTTVTLQWFTINEI